MTSPATMALLASLASSGAQAFGNYQQGRQQEKERQGARQFEQRRNSLIDELLSSVEGNGKFSSLFATDDDAFQRSIVDPAKKMFSNQIAPQIQQSAIAGGSQFGTGVEDQLTRAGVDLDSMINQQYQQFQQAGQDRMGQALGGILGQQPATPFTSPPNFAQTLGGGMSGFLSSPAFGEMFKKPYSGSSQDESQFDRKGFAPSNNSYNPKAQFSNFGNPYI